LGKLEQSNKLDLDRIIFIGRTFEEYTDMFSLNTEEMKGKRILDCPAGACSFTAIGNQLGLDITACDIAYFHSGADLEQKGYQDIEHAMEQMERVKDYYKWDYFKDIKDLKNYRLTALKDCSKDMIEASGRYIPVTLPTLPFSDGEFDVTLSAHFLFMYGDRLDYQFHLSTIQELLRVSKEEIRIFPLVDLEGKPYEHLDKLVDHLEKLSFSVEEVKVSYEFMKNANSMIKIKKARNARPKQSETP
jgi:hypothetical protein